MAGVNTSAESARAAIAVGARATVLSSRVRWTVSFVVLIPLVATLLVFGRPMLSTAAGDFREQSDQQLAALVPGPPGSLTIPAAFADALIQRAAAGSAERTEGPKLAATGRTPSATFERPVSTPVRPGSGRFESEAAARSRGESTESAGSIPDDDGIRPVQIRRPSPIRTQPTERRIFLGTISVVTQPDGAQVSVDGRYVGVTPLVNWELPAGSHVVRIEHEGCERWSGAVQAIAEKTVNVAVTLQPARPGGLPLQDATSYIVGERVRSGRQGAR